MSSFPPSAGFRVRYAARPTPPATLAAVEPRKAPALERKAPALGRNPPAPAAAAPPPAGTLGAGAGVGVFPPPPNRLPSLSRGSTFSSRTNSSTVEATFRLPQATPMPLMIPATVVPFSLIHFSASFSPCTAPLAVSTREAKPEPPSPTRLVMIPAKASFSPARAACPSSDCTNSSSALTAVLMASATCWKVGARAASASYFSLSNRAEKSCMASSTPPKA